MTLPKIDSRDYVTNPQASKPTITPEKIWVVYYKNINNEWTFCLPNFYHENASKLANIYSEGGLEVKILEYDLSLSWQVSTPKKTVKKIRKVRQVID